MKLIVIASSLIGVFVATSVDPPECTPSSSYFTVIECELNRVCILRKQNNCRIDDRITWARSLNYTNSMRENKRVFLTKKARLVIPSVSEMDAGDYYFFENVNGEKSVCDYVCLRVIPERNRIPVDMTFNDTIRIEDEYLIQWSEWTECECTPELNEPSYQIRKGDYGKYYNSFWKSNSNLTSYIQLRNCISDCIIDEKHNLAKIKNKTKKYSDLTNVDLGVGIEKPIQSEFKIIQEGQGARLSCDIDRTRHNMAIFPYLNVKWEVNFINFSLAGRYFDQELDLLVDDQHNLIILNRTTMTLNDAVFVCYLNERPKKIIQLSLEWYTDTAKFMADVKTLGFTIMILILIVVLIFESCSTSNKMNKK